MIRTLRVLKIFVRLPELKKIISALSHSIVPMLNAFLIVLVMMAMCATRRRPDLTTVALYATVGCTLVSAERNLRDVALSSVARLL